MIREDKDKKRFPFVSVVFLIGVNLIPLYGVLAWGWKLFSILFLYWLESFVIGAFTVLKIGKAKGTGRVNPSGETVANVPDLQMIPFFLFHYGLFMFVHLVFILVLFWPPTIAVRDLLLAFGSLWVSHGISYVSNFLGREEYRRTSPEQQMFAPYPRILIMHLTILFGGAIAKSIGAPPAALVIMISLKIIVDVYFHLAQHGFVPAGKRFSLSS